MAQAGHTESASSEMLLEAVTVSIAHVLNAESLKMALPEAMQTIATVVQIDRVVIFEKVSKGNIELVPPVFFVWSSATAPQVNAAEIIANSPDRKAIEAWMSPVRQGQAVIGMRRLLTGPMRKLMTQLQTVSMLQVPIMLNGVYSGVIIFEDCKSEHEWTRAEITVLKLLAESIGAAAARERTREDARYGELLLSAVNASVVEIMTAPDLHQAISISLERVAVAVRADRMFVFEVVHTASGKRLPIVRNYWTATSEPAELDATLKALSQPAPGLLSLVKPLEQGHVVRIRLNVLSGETKAFFERITDPCIK